MLPGLIYSRHFKPYIGIRKCIAKLRNWRKYFVLRDLNTANKTLDWYKVPVISLKD